MKDDAFQAALETLGVNEPPRVWSFIVTVFGDLAQQQGDMISGPVLGDILSPVGVRPEAMRVALHRLRNEGWIETTKDGRVGLHSLSDYGIRQSAAASRIIYANANPASPDWHILCYATALSGQEHARASKLAQQGYIALSSGVYLSNRPCQNADPDAMVLKGTLGNIPVWVSRSLASNALRQGFNDLHADVARLELDTDIAKGLTPLQIATLRALIVHRWRKLVLKLPAAPDILFGAEFEGTICRAEVMRLLSVLHRPAIVSRT